MNKLSYYRFTLVLSLVFALAGFSYNVWRLEVSESNNTIRSAAVELLLQLAELEQVVYAAHYDNDLDKGNPRQGWVKVGLIRDLSLISGEKIHGNARGLHEVWSDQWSGLGKQQLAADEIIQAIDQTRAAINNRLLQLQ